MKFWSVVGGIIVIGCAFLLVLALLCLVGDLVFEVTRS